MRAELSGSELAIIMYAGWFREREKIPDITKLCELYLCGKVLCDSPPRGAMQPP